MQHYKGEYVRDFDAALHFFVPGVEYFMMCIRPFDPRLTVRVEKLL